MANKSIIQYLWIGGKLFIVGLIGGLIMMVPYALLGLGTSVATLSGGGTNALVGIGAVGVALFVVGLIVDGIIANKLWKWN